MILPSANPLSLLLSFWAFYEAKNQDMIVFMGLNETGAGGENRTRVISLEGWSNTIIRHPRGQHRSGLGGFVKSRGVALAGFPLVDEGIDYGLELAGLFKNIPLAHVARTLFEDAIQVRQFFGTVELHSGGRKRLNELMNEGTVGFEVAGFILDDSSIEPPTCGAPFVFAQYPMSCGWRQFPVLVLLAEMHGGAVHQRGHSEEFLHRWQTIAHTQLHGAEAGMRANIPPHFADALDGTGVDKRIHKRLEFAPVGEVFRQTGGGEGFENFASHRSEASVVALPKGRAGGEC